MNIDGPSCPLMCTGEKRTFEELESDDASIFGIIDPIREEILKTRSLFCKLKLGSSSSKVIDSYSFNSVKVILPFEILPGKESEMLDCTAAFEQWKETHKKAVGKFNELSTLLEEYDLVKRQYQHGDLSYNLEELRRRVVVFHERETEISDVKEAFAESERQFFHSVEKYTSLLDGKKEDIELAIGNLLASFPSKLGENFPEDRYKGLDLAYLNLLKNHLQNEGLEWFNNTLLELFFQMGDTLEIREMLTNEDRNSDKYRGFNKLYPDCLGDGEINFPLRVPFDANEEQNQRIHILSTIEGVRNWLEAMEEAGFDPETGWNKREGSSELKKSAVILYCLVFTPDFFAEPDVKRAVALAGKVISYYFTNELPTDYHC